MKDEHVNNNAYNLCTGTLINQHFCVYNLNYEIIRTNFYIGEMKAEKRDMSSIASISIVEVTAIILLYHTSSFHLILSDTHKNSHDVCRCI